MVKINKEKMKKIYSKLIVSPLEVSMRGNILASSVVHSATVSSVGQEVAIVYDLSATDGIDTFTGKTFVHEWEEGSGI